MYKRSAVLTEIITPTLQILKIWQNSMYKKGAVLTETVTLTLQTNRPQYYKSKAI